MKKKILLTLLVVMMLVCALAISASAADITVNGINYKTSGTTATFNADNPTDGTVTELVIPETVTHEGVTYNVTGVSRGGSWPSDNAIINSVVSVVLPATVNSVPSHMFRNYMGLKSVTIKGAVTSFNNAEFYHCYALEEVILKQPSVFTKVGGNVFEGCKELTTFDIPSTVTNVGNSAFYGCTKLTGVVNLPNLTYLGSSGFRGCAALTGVTIGGATITSIQSHCFYGCASITYADISGLTNITSINENGFRECYALASITIPSTVTSVGSRAFMATKIKTVVIPSNVTSIGEYAFNGCSLLETVTMGNNVTSIGDCVFQNCSSLKSINLSNSLVTLGCNNFQGTKVTRIVLPATLTTTAKDMFHGSTLKEIVIANPTVSGYTSSLLANTGSLKLVFYAGEDATVLTTQIGQLSNWTNFVSYEQYLIDSAKEGFTGYDSKTIVYGTDNCSNCSDIANDETTFVYTDYLSAMHDKCICDNCNAESVVKTYAPMFKFLGYSAPEKEGVYSFCVGYSINNESIKVFEEKTGKTASYGVVAVVTERVTDGKTPLEMQGTVPVINAQLTGIKMGSVSLKITGFSEAQKSIQLTMALYVITTKNEESSTVYLQKTQTASPSGYSIAQYEADNIA